jgi:hypothetical protein
MLLLTDTHKYLFDARENVKNMQKMEIDQPRNSNIEKLKHSVVMRSEDIGRLCRYDQESRQSTH